MRGRLRRLNRMTVGVAVAVGAAVVLALIPASGAGAGVDETKPVLELPTKGSFVEGGVIGAMLPVPEYGVVETNDIPMQVAWRAFDESGICGYKVAESLDGWPPRWKLQPLQSAASWEWSDDDYIDQQGGGHFHINGYDVRAYDCAGNHRTKYVSGGPIVWQNTGESYGYGELDITYSGTWGVSNCACWSGGTTHRTSQAGASATFQASRGPIALVMETAPDRGAFELWIDGQYHETVNTFATEKQHRTIVWAGNILGAGSHTVRIVNLASPDHPRIDLDAVLTH